MSQQLTIAFVLFAIVAAFTPGPNNAMVLASGLNFGFRRTLPHVAGIAIGFGIVVLIAGFGLGAVFKSMPLLYAALKYGGAAYLSTSPGGSRPRAASMTRTASAASRCLSSERCCFSGSM